MDTIHVRHAVSGCERVVIDRDGLGALIGALIARGYRVVGPTVRESAIVYDEIESVADLPEGVTDDQDGGRYRLVPRGDRALFGYATGPHSWKRFLHPPRVRLWSAAREGDGFRVLEDGDEPPKLAFLGVRPCDLRAIAIQDHVLLEGPYVDPVYAARRERVFVIAVNCGAPAGTCFCASADSGPKATSGFDLALTEVLDGARHYFVVDVGSPEGGDVLAGLPRSVATGEELRAAEAVVVAAAGRMGRAMETEGLKEVLYRNYEHPRWNEVASRCLTCANCTMVCPTCFCTSVEDVTDLAGDHAERWRRWDSCFTLDFSYIHGGSVRATPRSRYRQWMTHKLATWFDQFGTSGCVGCGRCITWCPVGIDITEEVRAIRETDAVAVRAREVRNGDA